MDSFLKSLRLYVVSGGSGSGGGAEEAERGRGSGVRNALEAWVGDAGGEEGL